MAKEIPVEKFIFSFPNDWEAEKCDDWIFHVNQFQNVCGGSKSVDVLAIDPRECVWIIEAKDYRMHRRTKTIELPQEIALKVRDTLAALVAARLHASVQKEKAVASRAMTCTRLRVVLHLEQPAKNSKLFPRAIDPAVIKQRLKQLIRAIDPHPLVVETSRMGDVAWTVK